MRDTGETHEPTIEIRAPEPHAALIVLGGEHDLSSADELRRAFDQSLAVCDHLIVDLSAAMFIDSTTILVLKETRDHAIGLGREFSVVIGTAAIVERVLEISGILPLLNVVPTVERALVAQRRRLGADGAAADDSRHANAGNLIAIGLTDEMQDR